LFDYFTDDTLKTNFLTPLSNTFIKRRGIDRNDVLANARMFSVGNLSDSGVLAGSDDGGSIWRVAGGEGGGRQERPMSLVSSASTDDTGIVLFCL